jgi:sec-independent protein translocase protein TatB
MFGMGMSEIAVILVVALIFIGPKKLPEIAKTLGRALNEFRRATTDLKEAISIDSEVKDVKSAFDQMSASTTQTPPATPSSAADSSSPVEQALDELRQSVEVKGTGGTPNPGSAAASPPGKGSGHAD